MIINFTTVADLRRREPELARLLPNDEVLEALINKAFNDFCLQFKFEYGYNPTSTEFESPYNTLIEYLALSYIFESLIKTDDIYITKADRYKNFYEEKFAKLNSNYSSGLYGTCETIGMLR